MGVKKGIVESIIVLIIANGITRGIFYLMGFDATYSAADGVTFNEIIHFNVEMLTFTFAIALIYVLVVKVIGRSSFFSLNYD